MKRLTALTVVLTLLTLASALAAYPAYAVASITLNPKAGRIGTLVSIWGSGFNTGDHTCTLSSTPTDIIGSPYSCHLSGGVLSATYFPVKATATPGIYMVTVTGSPHSDAASAKFTVTVPIGPTISLTPPSGPPSALVTVSGSGFSTSDAGPCTITTTSPTYPIVVTNPTCTVTPTGHLTGSYFTVGQVATGAYAIIVQGITGDTASRIFTVTGFTPPLLTLNPNHGPVGTFVSVSGGGFNPADYCNSGSFSSSPPGLMSATSCSMANGQIVAASFTVAGDLASGKYTVTLIASTLDSAQATFTVDPVTMTVSYSVVGGGSPTAPVFHYVVYGVGKSLTLTKVATNVKVDGGSSWSVTPNPLGGSGSSQRWHSTQPLSGTASATTIQFIFQHQYYLTMVVHGPGTVTPSSGWYNAGDKLTITATANAGHIFKSWTGAGSGSYTGFSSSHTITMNSAIIETATFT